MGFDKTKVVRAAEKYLSQGKIPAAIKEYRKIVEHEPEDFTALNMLGDLYVREGNKQEAIRCFSGIAEHYREQGFALKAIAMYKKIDRLNPGSVELAHKLAALYEMQGLMVEARAQYLIVADAYTQAGQSKKALEIFRRIADLDPSNTDIRLKLAQGYLREGFQTNAAEAFIQAGSQLFTRGHHERALEAYTKALEIVPHDRAALSGLLNVHTQLGTADEVAELLERSVAAHPDDVELLSMLSHAYTEAEDAPAAERSVGALAEREPSSYLRFLDVVRLYLKLDDAEAAVRVVGNILEQMLAGDEVAQLLEVLTEVLARNPEQMDALRLLVRVHTWQHDEEKMRVALERLAEAAEAAGLADEERHALAQLARLAPDEPRYRERLRELGGSVDELEQEAAYSSGSTQEVPTFESFMVMNEQSEPEAPAQAAVEFEWNSVSPTPSDPSSSFADLNDWADTSTPASFETEASEPGASSGFQEFNFSTTVTPPAAAPGAENETASPDLSRRDAMLRQEMESVDFYLAQGYTDIALDTLEMLERQFGQHAEIDARRAQLKKAGPAKAAPAAQDEPPASSPPAATVEFTSFARYDVAEESPAPAAEAADIDDAFAQLESAPQAPVTPPPPSSTAPATTPAKPGIDPGLAAIFDEFKSAVEDDEPSPTDGDYETHYNLGLAYKEMDLVDEAVEEFQMAAGMVSPQDGTPRYLQCCNLLGHCFMQKGMPRLAVMWFKKGLDSPGHTEDEYQALRFELGTAYEQMGDLDSAIDVFTEVYGVNVSYRGVADKLRDLQKNRDEKSDVRG